MNGMLWDVREFFLAFPLLEAGAPLGVDQLFPRAPAYALCGAQGGVQRRYLDGGSLRRLDFLFCARAAAGDTAQSLRLRRFFEALERWMEAESRFGRLPSLAVGRRSVSLCALGEAQAEESGPGAAVWRLPCRLVYLRAAARPGESTAVK